MHDRVTICGGVLGGHPRLVADAILALSVANCRSTWRWRDGSSARIGAHRKAPWDKPKVADRQSAKLQQRCRACSWGGVHVEVRRACHVREELAAALTAAQGYGAPLRLGAPREWEFCRRGLLDI